MQAEVQLLKPPYLIDGMEAITSDEAVLETIDALRAVVIRAIDGPAAGVAPTVLSDRRISRGRGGPQRLTADEAEARHNQHRDRADTQRGVRRSGEPLITPAATPAGSTAAP